MEWCVGLYLFSTQRACVYRYLVILNVYIAHMNISNVCRECRNCQQLEKSVHSICNRWTGFVSVCTERARSLSLDLLWRRVMYNMLVSWMCTELYLIFCSFLFSFRCWRVRPKIMSACCSTTVWRISCDSKAIWVSAVRTKMICMFALDLNGAFAFALHIMNDTHNL